MRTEALVAYDVIFSSLLFREGTMIIDCWMKKVYAVKRHCELLTLNKENEICMTYSFKKTTYIFDEVCTIIRIYFIVQ